jgi:polyhydroxyalkanoate synthase
LIGICASNSLLRKSGGDNFCPSSAFSSFADSASHNTEQPLPTLNCGLNVSATIQGQRPARYRIADNLQTDTEVTYLLTAGGHNAGIVSEPNHPDRSFQVTTRRPEDHYLDPEAYLANAPRKQGSWRPEWASWLAARSEAPIRLDPVDENPALCDAPGTYVLQD